MCFRKYVFVSIQYILGKRICNVRNTTKCECRIDLRSVTFEANHRSCNSELGRDITAPHSFRNSTTNNLPANMVKYYVELSEVLLAFVSKNAVV